MQAYCYLALGDPDSTIRLLENRKEINISPQLLAESAYADACRPGNPRDTSVEEIVELYKSQL